MKRKATKTKQLSRRECLNRAAPVMLSALKHAIAQADANFRKFGRQRTPEGWKTYSRCVAAIAKAEGR